MRRSFAVDVAEPPDDTALQQEATDAYELRTEFPFTLPRGYVDRSVRSTVRA